MKINRQQYEQLIDEHFVQSDIVEFYNIVVPIVAYDHLNKNETNTTHNVKAELLLASGKPVFVFWDEFKDGEVEYVVVDEKDLIGTPELINTVHANEYMKSFNKNSNKQKKKPTLDYSDVKKRMDIETSHHMKNRMEKEEADKKKEILNIIDTFNGFVSVQFDDSHGPFINVVMNNGETIHSDFITTHVSDDIDYRSFEDAFDQFGDEISMPEELEVFYLDKQEIDEFINDLDLSYKSFIKESLHEFSFMDDKLMEELLLNPDNEDILFDNFIYSDVNHVQTEMAIGRQSVQKLNSFNYHRKQRKNKGLKP